MTKRHIEDSNLITSTGETIVSAEIRGWFVSFFFDFSNTMGINCDEGSGCGVDDLCPGDSRCVEGGDVHECPGTLVYMRNE